MRAFENHYQELFVYRERNDSDYVNEFLLGMSMLNVEETNFLETLPTREAERSQYMQTA